MKHCYMYMQNYTDSALSDTQESNTNTQHTTRK